MQREGVTMQPVNVDGDVLRRNEVVAEYAWLVSRVASKIAARLPSNVELDDLKSVGVMGLIDAAERYEAGRGSFRAYAEIRIRGAILDELRSMDWVPRSVRQLGTNLEATRRELQAELGRKATEGEVADRLGISVGELQAQDTKANASRVVSFESLGKVGEEGRDFLETVPDTSIADPEQSKFDAERIGMLLGVVRTLPERMRLVLSLYYFEDFSLREIGELLGVTESRVSQLHSAAVDQIRPRLQELLVDYTPA